MSIHFTTEEGQVGETPSLAQYLTCGPNKINENPGDKPRWTQEKPRDRFRRQCLDEELVAGDEQSISKNETLTHFFHDQTLDEHYDGILEPNFQDLQQYMLNLK